MWLILYCMKQTWQQTNWDPDLLNAIFVKGSIWALRTLNK